ncbi:MAG: PAS domain-containing protein [Sphingomonadales bacterium]|nr:PAS domain-containing protein [Sphingomonadales bacterium]MDE2168136.1 PAS domain-containing protein [Sphingomonadales bacterium]
MPISDMIKGSQVAAVISNPRLPDNPIIDCNGAFEALTGYTRDEVIGRNCRFLTGPGSEPALIEALREGIRDHRPVMVEILNYRKNGTPFRNAVMVAPLFDSDGQLEYFLGSQMEIPEDHDASRVNAAREKVEHLSPRQRAVLLAMARGQLNKQIAYELGLSERTIKMHRAAMFQALGVRTAADAVRLAIEAGF